MNFSLPFLGERLLFYAPVGGAAALLFAFLAMGLLGSVYAFSSGMKNSRTAVFIHILGGVTVLFAGDLVTLLAGWEILAFSAFFIITGSGKRFAARVGYEYIAFQIVAAAALFTGMLVQISHTGSLEVGIAAARAQPFILLAVALKTAAIPLHFWLVDAYPAAPFGAAPLLSVFTTKVGVYTAARLLDLPVTASLGAVMAVAGVIWALRQHSARKLLSYHIISQVGYMLVGVGLATEPGIAAGLFHAVNNIVYKSLLFMVVGAVIYRTGHDRLSGLGDLRRQMPVTFVCGIIASASIIGVPLFSGFMSKALLKNAAGYGFLTTMMTLAGIGTGISFIKLMYLIFIQQASMQHLLDFPGRGKITDPPMLMKIPMLLLAAACVAIGVYPVLPGLPGLPELSVFPGSDPGFPYYTLSSVLSAMQPITASVLLWLLFRKRFLSGLFPFTLFRGGLMKSMLTVKRTGAVVTRIHSQGFQLYYACALLIWIAFIFFL